MCNLNTADNTKEACGIEMALPKTNLGKGGSLLQKGNVNLYLSIMTWKRSQIINSYCSIRRELLLIDKSSCFVKPLLKGKAYSELQYKNS